MVKLVLLAGLLLLIMTAAERLLPPPEIPPEIERSPDPLGSPQDAYLRLHNDDELVAKP